MKWCIIRFTELQMLCLKITYFGFLLNKCRISGGLKGVLYWYVM